MNNEVKRRQETALQATKIACQTDRMDLLARGIWPWLILRRSTAYHGECVPVPRQLIVPGWTSTFRGCLARSFRIKRLGLLTKEKLSSLTVHTKPQTRNLLQTFCWETLDHPRTVRISHSVFRICFPLWTSTGQDIVSLR